MTDDRYVQGIPFSQLAERFGTPLFVYDGAVLADRYGRLRDGLDPPVDLFYSLKANPNVAVCAALRGLGAGAEVSSLAELETAFRAGVPAADIIFPGPGKSPAELAACLDAGIHAIVCESVGELALVNQLARARGTRARVAIRVNPEFSLRSTTLAMGGKPRQFGIDETQLRREGLDLAGRFPHVEVIGVHVYMGTRILDANVVVENTVRILDLARDLSARLGFPLRLVDVGGGLGVPYFEGERELDTDAMLPRLNEAFGGFRTEHPGTRLVMELGRYLTAPAGTYLIGVRYTKTSQGERFAVADGGTHHHLAAVGIGSFVKRDFPMFLANRDGMGEPSPWTIAGPLCTPNDTLGRHVALPALRPGDLLGVRYSGAYGPTASPGLFLGHGYPAEVLVHSGVPYLVRERDEPADLLARQHLPDPLAPVPTGAGPTRSPSTVPEMEAR
ncbi:MAG: diaminopimelate decarboxylase [Actinobacteria bacterium 13_2_20CM_2_71_6]|nr:MAG: diaminopimelate decarboxylase [Actinobacteria bacterium 13_2_20CM_2_71_6]